MNSTMIALAALATANAESADTLKNVMLSDIEIISTVKEHGQMRQQPSAVSLLGPKELESTQATSLKGASRMVPNLFIPDYGSRLTSAIYIRGIGSRMNTPAVGLYVDNVPYIDKSAFDFNFYDIERVDVLRGPQGTLYGRNTMGGLVRVFTLDPFHGEGTTVRLGYASGDNHRNVSLTHFHRLSDKMAFSAGGYYEGSDGFFENVTLNKKVDGMQAGGGRIRMVWLPSKPWRIDASVNYDYSDEGAYPYFHEGKITNNRENNYRRNLLNAGVNVEYTTEKWQMNAITGYQNLCDRMFLDQDFRAVDIYSLEQKQRINTVTEEVTLKSRGNEKWQHISGLHFMYQALHTTGPVTFYTDGLRWLEEQINSGMPQKPKMNLQFVGNDLKIGGVFDTPSLNVALFHQSALQITDRFSATLGLRLGYEHNQMDYSAPSSFDYDFMMPDMRITLAGLHSTITEYEGTLNRDTWQVLPKVALKFDVTEHSNLYASVAMGQRSGGYNLQMFSDLIQGAMQKKMMDDVKQGVFKYLDEKMPAMADRLKPTIEAAMPKREMPTVDQVVYKPENSVNYEVGSHLTFPDARVRLDAALFWSEIKDQQIARFAPSGLGRMMVNAGESRSRGGELSVQWQPVDALTLGLNYGYARSTFEKYDDGSELDYTGNLVPFAPMHTLSYDVAYSWPVKSCGEVLEQVTLGLNGQGAGRIYWNEANTAWQNFYMLPGARLALEGKHASLTLWGKNLADKEYNTFWFESVGLQYEQHGKPLQVGVDVKIKF
ncbi:MAG: TonB-dependent receptor [Bacteroidales bacterium]|nr:TonB-dependent receptor [Bacteroidales bacterium]